MTSATPKPRAGEHTKGPWSVDNSGYPTIIAGEQVVTRVNGSSDFDKDDRANARRIVAAVNACEGVPIDELEGLAALKCDIPGLAGVAQMAVVNSEHEAERDLLRERERGLVEALQILQSSASSHLGRGGIMLPLEAAILHVRDILSKHGR